MQPRRLPDRGPQRARLVGILSLSVLLLAGCVQQKDPKVGITKVEADLVFGVKERPAPVTPANTDVDEPIDDTQIPYFKEFKLPDNYLRLPKVASDTECPKAPPSAAAKDASDVNITGKPREGLYRWVRAGEQKPAGAPPEVPGVKITGFEKRVVRNTKVENPTTHTFETVQVANERTAIVSTFRVRTDAINQATTGGVPVISGPRAGEPDRGISLVKIESIDNKGEVVAAFNPTTPILYLPLPVSSGEQFQSTGIDPRTGQTIIHEATVLGRERVDACGELVDGWAVEARQTTTNGDAGPAAQVTYRYILATQYGGMMVSERLKYETTTVSNDLIFTLGQFNPDPLPPQQG